MACTNVTLAGITLGCETSKGGIQTVYLVQASDVESVGLDTENQMIQTITLGASKTGKEYQFRKNTGSMTSTLNVDETTGNNYVTTEVSLVFSKMETAKRIEMAGLAIGQFAIIVKDSNEKYWYIGPKNNGGEYVSSSAGTGTTGTAKTDQNAYTLTLSADTDSYPFEIDPTKIDTIIAGA